MISVDEAKTIVKANSFPKEPILISLQQAAGCVLAQDVFAKTDLPPFDQAAMDGYAFAFKDWDQHRTMQVNGEVPAGFSNAFQTTSGQVVRIFTGAPVPQGADTVVMQEQVSVAGNTIQINDTQLQQGTNVRLQGSEIKKATLALKKQTYLSPAAIGFLAACGVTHVWVYPKPAIALIITGNELQQPGQPLQAGQVYESNSFMLNAALQQFQMLIVQTFFVRDHVEALQEMLSDALLRFDMILLTGGVSAGDYDFVVQAASRCGIMQLFHKVAQKPGKPLYFGAKQNRLVFGLPGNPSSVLTCFYQYVIPALESVTGRKELLRTMQAILAAAYSKKAGVTHFLKGWYANGEVWPLPAQESYKLHSFATANCLIVLEAEGTDYKVRDQVAIHLLPS